MELVGLLNYWIVIVLMMTGFYIVISHGNLVKKIVGLNVFQVSVFLLVVFDVKRFQLISLHIMFFYRGMT